jgi:hypothetical protein
MVTAPEAGTVFSWGRIILDRLTDEHRQYDEACDGNEADEVHDGGDRLGERGHAVSLDFYCFGAIGHIESQVELLATCIHTPSSMGAAWALQALRHTHQSS